MSKEDTILKRARPDIMALEAYSSARSLFKGNADTIFLDANEMPDPPYIGAGPLNRYPEQQPDLMIRALSDFYDLSSNNFVATRGADEAIDVLIKSFCEPRTDNIIICPPTFPMYAHSAHLHATEVKNVQLDKNFLPDLEAVKSACDSNTKIIFLCSPNNPTGNAIPPALVKEFCEAFDRKAVIALDETYIEYAEVESMLHGFENYPNLVVFRTLSKSCAAAGLRCGIAAARQDVIDLMKKVLVPYPVSYPVMAEVARILSPENKKLLADRRGEIVNRKEEYSKKFQELESVERIYASDANFILVKAKDAGGFVKTCLDANIIVRNQSHQQELENTVRIAIGSEEEMDKLIAVLKGEKFPGMQNDRTAHVTRKTNETAIDVAVNLDRTAPVSINTGIGFYDHMLEQVAKHGGFSLTLACAGDLHIDPHHTIEDCAIALGQGLKKALGAKHGIGRYGFSLPMDEARADVVLDLSGRYFLKFEGDFPADHVGDLPTDMIEHIFRSLAENLQANLHVKVDGDNTHHMVEACFKGVGRALRQAIKYEGGDAMPSTKGSL